MKKKKGHMIFGWKHIKPPKNCNHKYNFFTIKIFGNIWTSVLVIFSCFNYIWLALDLIKSIILKIPSKIEKFECMEYIYDQIISIIKFENLNMYLKSKVVDGIFRRIFFYGAWYWFTLIKI
jgi:hypothetical protein